MTFVRGRDRWLASASEAMAGVVRDHEELRPAAGSGRLGVGTLACDRCDAPVAIGGAPLSPAHELTCPFCRHRGRVRDFLSLASPTRPARVVVRVGRVG